MTNPMDSTNLENDAFYLNDKNRQHKNANMDKIQDRLKRELKQVTTAQIKGKTFKTAVIVEDENKILISGCSEIQTPSFRTAFPEPPHTP